MANRRTVAGGAISLLFLLPLVWASSASLRETGLPLPRSNDLIPSPIAWENYSHVINLVPVRRFALNSLFVVAIATPLTVVMASLGGYAISQLSSPWRGRAIGFAVVCLMMPLTAIWIPRFLLVRELGLIDNRFSLILPSLWGTSPLFVLIFTWTFARIPREIIEAAHLEGCGPFRTWLTIGMPLARPASVAVAVLSAVHFWNSYIEPLLFIRTQQKMMASQGLRMIYQLDPSNWSLLMTGSIMMIGPVVLLFAVLQRFFLQNRRGHSILGE